jgi:peptidoglycan hydrolase-like protein with peptidoglycan-binding domain
MPRFIALLILVFTPLMAAAQDRWVQIEAQPSLLEAEARARDYSSRLNDVQAFSIGSGWYAITLGPYSDDEATSALRTLLNNGAVPDDSFVSTGANYRQKIWPTGLSNDVTILPPATTEQSTEVAQTAPETTPVVEEAPRVEPSDETPRQAGASEAALSHEDRQMLQAMLQWAGYYNSTIDGAFGRGTRASMAEWQSDNGFEPTGILTTLQRQVLAEQYNAVLSDLGLETVTDDKAGISIDLPLAAIAFDTYAAPLVHYTSTTGGKEHVFLISQAGDRDDLAALFEVLQTLSILPRNAQADLTNTGFEISGPITGAQTYVTARLTNGEIKGYGIVWPDGNTEQTTRLLSRLNDSFKIRSGTLPADMAQDVTGDFDYAFGLEIRRPLMMRSGVYVANNGTIVTAAEGLDMCTSFVIEGDIDADLVEPNANGLAILQPASDIAPPATARLSPTGAAVGQAVYLASYPYGGRLSAPTITGGVVEDLRGLDNDAAKLRLTMPAQSNDIGGPVFDQFGNLQAILVSPNASGRILPNDAQVALNLIRLAENGASLGIQAGTNTNDALTEEALVAALSAPVALIECWEN